MNGMVSYKLFLDLAIILVAAKLFGLLARKVHAPQVVGEIVAGLIIGPNVLGLVNQSDFLVEMAEIGVILLMFMAGLETNLHDLLKTGPVAFLIAFLSRWSAGISSIPASTASLPLAAMSSSGPSSSAWY